MIVRKMLFKILRPVGFVILYLSLLLPACSKLPVEHKVVKAQDDEIKIPLMDISDGKVHFFTYKTGGKRINFLVRTDGTGKLRTHFDACYACYRKKKGYRVEGTYLVCNECNLKYSITEEIWKNVGMGCSPIPFQSDIKDNVLLIKLKDIEKGKKLF